MYRVEILRGQQFLLIIVLKFYVNYYRVKNVMHLPVPKNSEKLFIHQFNPIN